MGPAGKDKRSEENRSVYTHPKPGIEFFERTIASTLSSEGLLFACTAYEKGDDCGIALFHTAETTGVLARINIPSAAPAVGQPALAANDKGLSIIWVTYGHDPAWRLMYTTVQDGQPGPQRCLWASQSLIMYPTLCVHDERLFVAFTAGSDQDDRLRILFAAVPSDGSCIKPVPLTASGTDANRATMASNGDQIMIAWDTMSGETCCINYTLTDRQGRPGPVKTIGRNQERWLSPLLAADNRSFYLSWVISGDVIDKSLGIVDHQTAAGFARITDESIAWLPSCQEKDEIISNDLRPGLLGSKKYSGYYGLRRRPQPVVSARGAVYQIWEMMFEPALQQAAGLSYIPAGPSLGKLMARKLMGDSWGPPTLIHPAGTNYAVPRNIPESDIPLVYLQLDQDQTGPIFRREQVRIEQGIPFTVSDKHWSRWQPYHHQAVKRARYETLVNDEPYKLYWADTHTHSVFSPDAEGEPDEIINFGRSVAGLDIMAIVDNDFYPFFGLTKLKWQIHLALADKFTREGAFVLFPGYEYTYHDRQLTPDFNHRYILYPRGKGCLYRRTDTASNTIEDLMKLLETSGALPVAHHTTWELGKSVIDRHVEVCSSWRVCKEESDFIDNRLQRGDRFSFIGSSDTHRAVPGLGGALTGVYARELTPEAIFDAYHNHRVIATQGNRTVIDLRVAGLFIGQAGTVQGDIPIKLTVFADSRIDYVSVIRDSDEIKRFTGQSAQLAVSFTDQQVEPGVHTYYVTVKLVGDPSFNAPEDVLDRRLVFFSDDKTRYPHNFARAEGPFAWCTPIWIEKTR